MVKAIVVWSIAPACALIFPRTGFIIGAKSQRFPMTSLSPNGA